ncbi:MAG: CPBP family intramembrane metalloprotease [Austwickia sp.]|nr:CPBP family intramembrane metalloprotease [Austwickia sp.]MBK8437100.1 CPBP family intramembrane metalloprotease [Austwickia sp.]MBK9102335.1 CPBP family intramembrane metalloprotease [Austwickia sp.]
MTNVSVMPGAAPPTPPVLAPGAEYQQSLRGPGHRWWRPLVSIVLVISLIGISTTLIGLVLAVVGLLNGKRDPFEWVNSVVGNIADPVGFLVTNLSLIALIPVVMFALWLAHATPPGQIASVTGRFRWGWFGRCLSVVVPLWLVLIGVSFVLGGALLGPRPAQWPALLLIMVLTTPLQAAGEEVAFRGWALLSIGSWFSGRWAALVVPLVLSVAAFAAAHGSPDPWVVADLSVFAAAAGALTWRTGGLEAAIALHVVNNVVAIGSSLLLGGFEQGFIDSETAGSPGQFSGSLVVQGIAVWLLWRQAAKHQLDRRTPGAANGAVSGG